MSCAPLEWLLYIHVRFKHSKPDLMFVIHNLNDDHQHNCHEHAAMQLTDGNLSTGRLLAAVPLPAGSGPPSSRSCADSLMERQASEASTGAERPGRWPAGAAGPAMPRTGMRGGCCLAIQHGPAQ